VLTGRFRDGERLDETDLARCFGLSRPPVHEDLQSLAAAGFAEQLPRRVFFARQYTRITTIKISRKWQRSKTPAPTSPSPT
jgi:DNA-binding GntR family transcriptional regulator